MSETHVPPDGEILVEIPLSNEDSNVKGSIWLAMNDSYVTVDLKFANEVVSVSLVSWSDSRNREVPTKLRRMAEIIEVLQTEADKPYDPNDIPF